ncbi:methyltransferase family protein [Pirellulaceae bacterium SH449]
MAVTGLSQGFGVGLMYGSPLVLIYVLCGGLIWQFLVRPLEEQMLTEQFGEEYCSYRRRVGLWVPQSVRGSK